MKKTCQLGRDAARESLTARVSTLQSLGPRARAQNQNAIHDMRVASRRVRSLAAAHAPYSSKTPRKAFQKQVSNVTTTLSAARELDVTLARAAALRKRCRGTTRTALSALIQNLRLARRQEDGAVLRCAAAVTSPEFVRDYRLLVQDFAPARTCYLDHAQGALRPRLSRCVKRFQRWRKSREDDDLHQLRIALKKLRYTCEIYAPVYGKSLNDLIAALKAMQTTLGDWNDYRILRNYVGTMRRNGPGAPPKGIAPLLRLLDRKVKGLGDVFARQAPTLFAKERLDEFRTRFKTPKRACCAKSGAGKSKDG